MSLAPGTKLGPYEIRCALGAGGMGEVYRASDSRLGRDVAIKILPAYLAGSSDARRRFEREAKAISSLNHPNICTLYDIGHQDGLDFIVMECLEGESLCSRLSKGPLPLDQALKYGAQIARGLSSAHRSGIIHRDLKPGNIMLTKSGAKILDFGIAKAAPPIATDTTLPADAQISAVTEPGQVVGTYSYMSPEQVQGKDLDSRSDMFSLGTVLYEMVTGRKAFGGENGFRVASAILEKEPEPITAIAPLTPANVDRVIRRCLKKDRDERWQTSQDLGSELEWISESGVQRSPTVPHTTQRAAGWLMWSFCGLVGLGLIVGALIWQSRRATRQPSYFLAMLPFTVHDMALSPNEHTIAVVGPSTSGGTNVLWLYEVGGQEGRRLPESEGASFPFWSPEGKTLAFFADGKMKKLEIAGGSVQVICDAPAGRGGTWSADGTVVFSPSGQLGGGLYQVPATGGMPVRITVPDAARGENSHRWPVFLPDGKHFLYLAGNISGQSDADAIFAGTLGSSDKRFIIKATGNAVYAPPGFLLFCRERTLYAQKFDFSKLSLSGEAVPLLNDVSYLPRIMHNEYSADAGVLVAQRGTDVSLSKLVWRDRAGGEIGSIGQPDVYANLALAPNGKAVGLDKTDQENQNADVWTYDLRRNSMNRLTFDPAIDATPVWSPDGTSILFASSRAGFFQMYVKKADGREDEKLLALDPSDKSDKYPSAWSPDGKHILYERTTEAIRLWVADLPVETTKALLNGSDSTKNGQFSPDGNWVAYTSNASGKWEIYVTSFPDTRGKWQISNTGGAQPRWRGDGKELFYLGSDGKMMAVPLTIKGHFESGVPTPLFQAGGREQIAGSELVTYDVTKDGQRFLINTQMESAATKPMTLVLNWRAKVEK
jgi:serine/threonine protein kinase/Tol biopolymer transport system component